MSTTRDGRTRDAKGYRVATITVPLVNPESPAQRFEGFQHLENQSVADKSFIL